MLQEAAKRKRQLRAGLDRGDEPVAEFLQHLAADIADGHKAEIRPGPMPYAETLHPLDRPTTPGLHRLRHEQIDDVITTLIDDRRNRRAVDVVDPTADQRKALRAEIDHGRRHVEAAIEPGLHGMLIGG